VLRAETLSSGAVTPVAAPGVLWEATDFPRRDLHLIAIESTEFGVV